MSTQSEIAPQTMFEKLAEVLTEGRKKSYEKLLREPLSLNHRIFQYAYHVVSAAQFDAEVQIELENEICELERQREAAEQRITELERSLAAAKRRPESVRDSDYADKRTSCGTCHARSR